MNLNTLALNRNIIYSNDTIVFVKFFTCLSLSLLTGFLFFKSVFLETGNLTVLFCSMALLLNMIFANNSIKSWGKLASIYAFILTSLLLCCTSSFSGIVILLIAAYTNLILNIKSRSLRKIIASSLTFSLILILVGFFLHSYSLKLLGVIFLFGIFPFSPWFSLLLKELPLSYSSLFILNLGIVASKSYLLFNHSNLAIHSTLLFLAFSASLMACTQNNLNKALSGLINSQLLVLLFSFMNQNTNDTKAESLILSAFILSVPGFLLCINAIQSRNSQDQNLCLNSPRGNYDSYPKLANILLLFGLVSAGFPLTLSYIGVDLLYERLFAAEQLNVIACIIINSLNAVFIMKVFLYICTGAHKQESGLDILMSKYVLALISIALLCLSAICIQ